MSDAGKTRLQEINAKIENKKLLTKEEKAFLDNIKKEIQSTVGKTPLKPSKKLLDGKTPLIKRENQKFPKNGESGGTNKKELSREFDLNRESSYKNTIADFYKKANKSTKISEDGTPYYIRVDDVKIEYKKPE